MIPKKLQLERLTLAGEPGGSGIRPLVVRSPASPPPSYSAEFIAPIMASSLRIMSSYQFIELCPGTGLATNNYPRWIFKPVCVLYLIKWTRRFRPMITTTLLLFSLCSVDLRALFIADLELLFG